MPRPSSDAVGQRLQRQGRRDTKPELLVRRELHGLGYRFRVDVVPERGLRCRGDIVFSRRKVVVFVDGCFWHVCPLHCHFPTANAAWWRTKLLANVDRDRRHDVELRQRDWVVVRVWEHQPLDQVVRVVTAIVGSPRCAQPTSG
ncbi:very short patch repair endonuclease [Jatrophihabitans sp. YIM 134969]